MSKTNNVMMYGGYEPEQRIDPAYIAERRARLLQGLTSSTTVDLVMVTRIDRTISELSKEYSIPILTGSLIPPKGAGRRSFYFGYDSYPQEFRACAHPDCCLPEVRIHAQPDYCLPEVRDRKLQACSACKKAVYCSRTCQKAHWKEHKHACQKTKQESRQPSKKRPSESRRHEKREGNILISWGFDTMMDGYFMTVKDERLQVAEDSAEAISEICYKIAPDGGGQFINMNTYPLLGLGLKVSEETIFSFMRRYGIDPSDI